MPEDLGFYPRDVEVMEGIGQSRGLWTRCSLEPMLAAGRTGCQSEDQT